MRPPKIPKPSIAKPPFSPEAAASVKAHREERKKQRQERKKRGRIRAALTWWNKKWAELRGGADGPTRANRRRIEALAGVLGTKGPAEDDEPPRRE
jgi:hypothetical protein